MKYIFQLLLKISPALEAGKIVSNPQKWKSRANLTGAILVLLGVVVLILNTLGVGVVLTDKEQAVIAEALVVLAGLFFPFANTVSTEKIGLPNNEADSGSDGDFTDSGMPSFQPRPNKVPHSPNSQGANGLRGKL